MQDTVTVALSQLIKKAALDAARAALSDGRYQVDTTVRVCGSLVIDPDCQISPTVSVPLKATLALFIRYAGITRETAIAHLTRAMTEAIQSGSKGEDALLAQCPAVEQTLATVQDRVLSTLPKVTRKGRVRAFLEVTEVTQGHGDEGD